ncbi:MAG: 3-keto-5-aminohexanoate cleavage protein [Pseudomonadota bacterium]|nr:3-keto-5-aminohexanoate cleavage protein [Pseudomonadota bacterium]
MNFSKIMINLAPTGTTPMRKDSPHVPLSVREIVDQTIVCADAGASIIHLHARDDDGLPTCDKEIYKRIIGEIRNKAPNLVLCVSLSGRIEQSFEKRAAPLFLEGDDKPDMASLTLSSLNFQNTVGINSPNMIVRLAQTMQERGIKPELEVFDAGMVNYAVYLIKKEFLRPPHYFNFILGGIATGQATPQQLGVMTSALPESSFWCGGGMGCFQSVMNAMGICWGNGVRTGLEDNLWIDNNRSELATNIKLVEQTVQLAQLLGRGVATALEVRSMLKLVGFIRS